jgi:hypothetical protein
MLSWVRFVIFGSIEQELDLFIQRPMLLFSASSAIRGCVGSA